MNNFLAASTQITILAMGLLLDEPVYIGCAAIIYTMIVLNNGNKK